MEKDQKKYEIAFILAPTIAEGDVLKHSEKIASIVTEGRGMLTHSQMPEKRKLAYPIKKERVGYFGWIKFTGTPDIINEIQKKLPFETSILRYLLVEDTIEMPQFRHIPRAPQIIPAEPKREEEADERLDLEALDKKLEEILGR